VRICELRDRCCRWSGCAKIRVTLRVKPPVIDPNRGCGLCPWSQYRYRQVYVDEWVDTRGRLGSGVTSNRHLASFVIRAGSIMFGMPR